jgi:hypothetical protein
VVVLERDRPLRLHCTAAGVGQFLRFGKFGPGVRAQQRLGRALQQHAGACADVDIPGIAVEHDAGVPDVLEDGVERVL